MIDPSLEHVLETAPFPHDTSGRYEGCLLEQIRRRAYEIYEARGNQPGAAEEDWLQAEREVKHHFGL